MREALAQGEMRMNAPSPLAGEGSICTTRIQKAFLGHAPTLTAC